VGGGWQESVDNHTTMMGGGHKRLEHAAADDEGSNKEGKVGKGDGDYNEGGA
jgi:hypothetical protein